jgi:hypothetical protein
VIESFVDLTYRGLSLGKRIKLGQVRPHSGYLELAAPMPVGSAIAIATDEGLTIDATVTWVYEQVAGSDRAPGMIVAPTLTGDAAAWWRARVALPEDDGPRPRVTRSRPTTLRPRTPTLQTPPAPPAPPSDVPAEPTVSAAAELAARVAAAAGVAPPRPTEPPPINGSTGEHSVIDDGQKTVIMQAIDPSELATTTAAPIHGDLDATTLDDSAERGDGETNHDGDHDDEPAEPPPTGSAAPTNRASKKRRRRR